MGDRRKKIWKRLQFWGGTLLVLVVGIGILAYVTYRKALGPPPTQPGKCREFDEHLADIDKDWLFLFWEMKRLVVCDIYGNEKKVLVDVGSVDHPFIEHTSPMWVFSPEGNWLLLSYELWDDKRQGQSESAKKIILIRIRDFAVFPILVPDPELTGWYMSCWLNDTTFLCTGDGEPKALTASKEDPASGCEETESDDLSSKGGFDAPSAFVTTGLAFMARQFKWYRYSVDEPGNPEEIDLPERPWCSRTGKWFLYDEGSELMLFATRKTEMGLGFPPAEPPEPWSLECLDQVMALDKDGQREATPEEEERFLEWVQGEDEDGECRFMSAGHVFTPDAYGISPPADAPAVQVEEAEQDPFTMRILKRLGMQLNVRQELRIEGRTTRRSEKDIWWHGVTPSLWEDNLRLICWGETLYVGEPADIYEFLSVNSYYTDEEGHYRFWHLGRFMEKFPRWEDEDERGEK